MTQTDGDMKALEAGLQGLGVDTTNQGDFVYDEPDNPLTAFTQNVSAMLQQLVQAAAQGATHPLQQEEDDDV